MSTRAFPNDEIYFHNGKGPASGRVVCSGAHGCTVEHEGKRHKVKWDKVLGHKTRAQNRLVIEESGEDGYIVRDGNGRRHFVAVPHDAKKDRFEVDK